MPRPHPHRPPPNAALRGEDGQAAVELVALLPLLALLALAAWQAVVAGQAAWLAAGAARASARAAAVGDDPAAAARRTPAAGARARPAGHDGDLGHRASRCAIAIPGVVLGRPRGHDPLVGRVPGAALVSGRGREQRSAAAGFAEALGRPDGGQATVEASRSCRCSSLVALAGAAGPGGAVRASPGRRRGRGGRRRPAAGPRPGRRRAGGARRAGAGRGARVEVRGRRGARPGAAAHRGPGRRRPAHRQRDRRRRPVSLRSFLLAPAAAAERGDRPVGGGSARPAGRRAAASPPRRPRRCWGSSASARTARRSARRPRCSCSPVTACRPPSSRSTGRRPARARSRSGHVRASRPHAPRARSPTRPGTRSAGPPPERRRRRVGGHPGPGARAWTLPAARRLASALRARAPPAVAAGRLAASRCPDDPRRRARRRASGWP